MTFKIDFSDGARTDAVSTALLVSSTDRDAALSPWDRMTDGQIRRATRAAEFTAQAGEICEILAPSGSPADRLLLVGMGDPANATALDLERLGGAICARLQQVRAGPTLIDTRAARGGAIDDPRAAAHVALGIRLRSYRFDRYRTRSSTGGPLGPTDVVIQTSDPNSAERAYVPLSAVASGVFLARDLVSEPANVLYPADFARRIEQLRASGVRVEVLSKAQLQAQGFGALLGVAQGSVHEPRVVVCEYDGRAAPDNRPPIVLAGKGVTFDAGGISIKPSTGLETLKQDMGGAASLVGLMQTLALRRAPCHVVAICGLVENMPSGTAQRPGDVVVSLSGKTIEVINTDAEGRLVLADLLSYAQKRYRPRMLIDMATLTGAIVIALGPDYAGLFCNDDVLARQLATAGEQTGERVWRYPMDSPFYDKQLVSQIADLKNLGSDQGRSIIAAQFIRRFVEPGVSWAHVDFGGTIWADEDTSLAPAGATGFGVRLLDRFIDAYAGD